MNSFFNTHADVTETRPTLPPLRSLNLPTPRINQGRAAAVPTNTFSPINNVNDFAYPANNNTPYREQTRSISVSSTPSVSSTSFNSRTPSPAPSEISLTSASSSRGFSSFRLVPCGLEDADAIVLVTEATDGTNEKKALLLVGPAAQPYRLPSARPVAKGARICPYKITPSQSLSRRSSTLSLRSQLG